MKITNRKFLVAGLLMSALTFVGCKSDKSAERPPDTSQPQPPPPPPSETGTPPAPQTNPGTGGSGNTSNISTTKPSDDNLRMPEDDPLRLRDGDKSVRDGETEQGVHSDTPPENTPAAPQPGTGGSGVGGDATDDNLNDGGNVDDNLRLPDTPVDRTTQPDGVTHDTNPTPEGTH